MALNYTIFRINCIVTFVLGCPTNLFLIWLILGQTNRELKIWSEKEMSLCKYTISLCIPVIIGNLNALLIFYGIYRQTGNCSIINSDHSEVYLFAATSGADGIIGQLPSLYATTANALTLCLIVITNFLIWRRMRQSLLPEQQHSVEVSRQVGRVLLLQATIPLLLTFIPAIVLILSIYFGQNVSFLSSFLYAQTWTCAIYPVAAMAMIGHYRRRIKKLIMSWKHGQSTVYPSTQ